MDYTEIIKAVVELVVAVLTLFVIPKLRAFLIEKAGKDKLERWQKMVETAVAAAEQTMEHGEEKKHFVMRWLFDRGIEYDANVVDGMIEAAVIRLHNELKGGAAE